MHLIRKATLIDLEFLVSLEHQSFSEDRRNSRRSLRNSITSNHQEVFILEAPHRIGAAVLHVFKHTVRVYSIAILTNENEKGYGKYLLEFCENHARGLGVFTLSLEADATNMRLINWYQKQNYEIKETLLDYYAHDINAFRMIKQLDNLIRKTGRLQNIVITERDYNFLEGIKTIEVITPNDYLSQKRFQTSGQYRIFNMTDSYSYQSKGYYMSLLASARDHRVIPNVATMSDIGSLVITNSISNDITDLIADRFKSEPGNRITYTILFGHETDGKLTSLSKALYQLFEAPCVSFQFAKVDRWLIESSTLLAINDMINLANNELNQIAKHYFEQRKFNRIRIKNYEYDLAILIDPFEENPPSNPIALEKFKKAGEKIGFFVEFITKKDAHRINEFDALFIRETTNVNSHTYLLARHAHAEGLIVIDDPWSILKCSNKFYLQERMQIAKIPMPKSLVLHTGIDWISATTQNLNFPMVIKQPDSAFSLGVHKVKTLEELITTTQSLFETSEFIIAQEFMPTDYDWRIGVLDNQAIFACKYLMAKDHWQIYNWQSEVNTEGDSIAVDLVDVPENILKTALKATSFIGDGFYGVDLKESCGKVYLIEINDNPNVEAGVEDVILGDQLYTKIMFSIKERIIKARNLDKYITI